ncbi:hypothetical protein [Lewinella sp. LCG006]|uniref:hypothetical protein n=1 Tax=Lewinella sp. LCG006 TaxID=3231911 RepID=UPI00345F5A37
MRERRLIRRRLVKKKEDHSIERTSSSSHKDTQEELIPEFQYVETVLSKLSVTEVEQLIIQLKTHAVVAHEEAPLEWLKIHLGIIINKSTTVPALMNPSDEAPLPLDHAVASNSGEEIPAEIVSKHTNDSVGAGFFYDHQEEEATQELLSFFKTEEAELEDLEEHKYLMDLAATLAPYWYQLLATGEANTSNELTLVQELQEILSAFLGEIKEFHHPTRKRLLMLLAKQCNSYLVELEFISPEYFAKVDPTYHNVLEEAGSRIKIGYSFLVIRKANYQVVFKADVITY